jgi:aspartyl/asparaginyl beta-hydroxylase (cupin superfamily)
MTLVRGERLGGVLITKIPAGKKCYPHIDTNGWHPSYYNKYYIPVLNKKGAIFGFEGLDIQGEEGSAYWFRNDIPHWVNNDSDSDRIALVVCVKPFKGI